MDAPLKRPLPGFRVLSRVLGARRAVRTPIRWCGSAPSICSKMPPANQIWPLVSPLLFDPVRGVRFISIVWLAAYANAAQERGDPKAIFKDPIPKFRPDLCCRL